MTPGTAGPATLSLDEIPPFHLLPAPRLRAMLAQTRTLRAERNEVIMQADDIPSCVHIVLDGEVRYLLPSVSGSEKLIRIIDGGSSFAEEAALLGRPAMAMAIAARSTLLLSIPVSLIHDAISETPAFALAFSRHLAAASYEMMAHVQLCLQLSSTQRVAQYLSQLAPQGAQRAEVRLAADKQTIAAQLNLTPETFSRVLSRFVREGLVRPQGRRGLLLDNLTALRQAASH